ncbi:MAG: response regulator, partial [Candidatus Hydrogenedentes bacterium]|nr:response regulator [Candidatus Hydrogenedentota bacterium]
MKVLVADDDVTSRTIVASVLKKWGYDVVTACDGEQAMNILDADEPPAVAVLDWMMPGLDGVEVCRKIKNGRSTDEKFVYVILLTAKTATEDLAAAMATGADDYIVKPFNNEELRARVRAGERIAELQHRLIEANHRLEKKASHDSLTGLLNRGAILDRLEIELERAKRHKMPLSVAMLDIDHFKQVNDSLGHGVGDEVLRQIARRIEEG